MSSVNGRFHVKGTLLPKYTFPHSIQAFHCVILIQRDYHSVAIVRNLQATLHEEMSFPEHRRPNVKQ